MLAVRQDRIKKGSGACFFQAVCPALGKHSPFYVMYHILFVSMLMHLFTNIRNTALPRSSTVDGAEARLSDLGFSLL